MVKAIEASGLEHIEIREAQACAGRCVVSLVHYVDTFSAKVILLTIS